MPDVFGVYDDMKVWEYLDFFARCYGLPADRRRRMIGDLLDLVDLGPSETPTCRPLARHAAAPVPGPHPGARSGRAAAGRAASGLDPRARVELRELLRELRSMGKTILVSSHILPELEELCTSVAIIDRGQVLTHGASPTSSGGCAWSGVPGPRPRRGEAWRRPARGSRPGDVVTRTS